MGIAVFAAIWAFVFFWKSFPSLIQFLIWRKHEVFEGRLGPFIRCEEDEKTKRNIYTLYINTEKETITTEYEQILDQSGAPALKEGDVVEVYYDPQMNHCRSKKEINRNLWMNPLLCLVGIVTVIICVVVAGN